MIKVSIIGKGIKGLNIIKTKLEFINNIGLTNHLSPTRANGLLEMVKQMKTYAYAFIVKSNFNKYISLFIWFFGIAWSIYSFIYLQNLIKPSLIKF